MWTVAVLVLCLGVASATDLFGEHKTYEGYQLFEMVPVTVAQQAEILLMFDDIELDFWDERRALGVATRMLVPPHKVAKVTRHLDDGGVPYTVTMKNYGEVVAAELSRLQDRARNGMVFDINDFNVYTDIMSELDEMAARCPAAITCTVETLGQSEEGRDIKVVRISGGAGRRGYWLDSAIHAREWLSPATMLMILDSFTRNYGTNDDITNLIDGYDWHFVPIMNPDGYEYSWTDERMWRKSRNVNAGSGCMGTDLNRNYDANWMSDGTSTSPCSDTYGGASAASAVETQIIQDELVRLGASLDCMWTVHTAAQMWLHSWGHTEGGSCAIADDDADLTTVIDLAVDAVEATHGLQYDRGNCCLTIYPASGGTMDFAKLVAGIKYTFTPELRGPNFVIDASNIQPSFEETFNGLLAMVSAIEANP